MLQYSITFALLHNFRTCGGGGASGVMLANRLSPTTSRRPTLDPSSSSHRNHLHINNNQTHTHDQKEHNLNITGQVRNDTFRTNFEFEDGNIRPPPSKFSAPSLISHRTYFTSSPSIASPVISHNLNKKRQSLDDTEKALHNDPSSTTVVKDLATVKRRRLVHSTTRCVLHTNKTVVSIGEKI